MIDRFNRLRSLLLARLDGQNDIKKLRRENEQLRREIWSLRDEYDKLEEIVKRQKSREEGEEYENHTTEEDELRSDYSCEEEEEEEEEEEDEEHADSSENLNHEEQLENAENQKISSEKMTSPHRLHVDFDDLSVVDEEEELKKDREKREAAVLDDLKPGSKSPAPVLKPRQLHDNIPFYPAAYETPKNLAPNYYLDCPFEFPNTLDLMIPQEPLMTSLDAGNQMLDQLLPRIQPPGWQTNLITEQLSCYSSANSTIPRVEPPKLESSTSSFSSLAQRRAAGPRQPFKFLDGDQNFESLALSSATSLENGWMTDGVRQVDPKLADSKINDKPRHFFAPLPSKAKKQQEEDSLSLCGTGNSSSSGRTCSTIVSKALNHDQKGSADICVNGAVPVERSLGKEEQRVFLSTDNLLIMEEKTTSNQLTKSRSCQDLSNDSQVDDVDSKATQCLAKSDNALDSIPKKPYKTHINVTLKIPQLNTTPEIPKLPSRLLSNPFLKSFDQSFQESASTPLSVHVNDEAPSLQNYYPAVSSSFARSARLDERYRQADRSRLLIPSDQLIEPIQDIQVTSFERPSPLTLLPPATPYDFATLRRLNPYLQPRNAYQNVPLVSRAGQVYPTSRLYPEGIGSTLSASKVPAQTQTSIDGDSHQEDEDKEEGSAPGSPSGQRRRKTLRKEKMVTKEQKQLSPAAQRRLKKQSSVTSTEAPDSPGKSARKKTRRLSVTTTTTSEAPEDKNESRSSSSGQDSPRKERTRRVSLYFNAKKRPSVASLKTTRSGSLDGAREKYADGLLVNSERERTNSVSSREMSAVKARKASTSSGSVPWCACWGNGCI
ncbi:hypothetical protein KM043_001311 [Ampulex compressa]|nr:hypothetical protein KM043_001311 [Ampulex compressa]